MMEAKRFQMILLAVLAVIATTAGVALRVISDDSSTDDLKGKKSSTRDELSSRTLTSSARTTSPLRESLHHERMIASVGPSVYADLMEAELFEATDTSRVFALASRWTKEEPEGYFSWLCKQPGKFYMREQGHFLGLNEVFISEMAKTDPKRAWAIAGELPGSKEDSLQIRALMEIAKEDPELTSELARENRGLLSQSQSGWWSADPLKTLPVLKELQPGPGRTALLENCVQSFAEQRADMGQKERSRKEDAKKWFTQLDPEMQTIVLNYAKRTKSTHGFPQKFLDAWTESGQAE